MEEEQILAALNAHWQASAAGDINAEHDIYDDDVICDYPQSGERIFGRNNLQALRGHHPGKPSGFRVRRILGKGDIWITEYIINYQEQPAYTVSIMEFSGGKVIHETQYFADPFEAPAWRSQKKRPCHSRRSRKLSQHIPPPIPRFRRRSPRKSIFPLSKRPSPARE